jgi:small GTP-binding protein
MATIKKKICLLGSFGVGKTSLVRQFVYNIFEESYLSTIGVSISQKRITLNSSKEVELLIWDIEGHEKFSPVVESYYTGASGAVLVADLTRPESLDSLEAIYSGFRSVNPDACFVFCANKDDLLYTSQTLKNYSDRAKKMNMPFFKTSAKNNENVALAFEQLSDLLL